MDNNNNSSNHNTRKRVRIESGISTMDSALSGLTGVQDNVLGADIDLGAALQSNLYFTICDDISDEEYLSVNGTSTHIKQEHKDSDLNNCGQSLQYRILNQLPKNAENTSSAVTLRTNCTTTAATLLPTTTTVQLPSGCEIYLVKEYVESDGDNMMLSEDCEDPVVSSRLALPQNVNVSSSTTQASLKAAGLSILPKTNIKIEPGTHTNSGPVATSYKKKRDERRRATHNEVERRRRDKINNWIFKLKEMLPKEIPTSNSSSNINQNTKTNNTKNMSNNAANRLPATLIDGAELTQQQTQPQPRNGNNCRSPPSDSKSQILIKACEYIKAMQEEVKSLRECLMENEKLRTSNNRLQNELQKLKSAERSRREQEQHQQQLTCDDSFDNSNNCASPSQDFTMTLCPNDNDHLDEVSSSTLFATTQTSPTSITLIGGRKASISVPYTKRELIITDYVD